MLLIAYTLKINNIFKIAQMLNWLVRMSAEFESNVTSVERIREYIDEIPHEVSLRAVL